MSEHASQDGIETYSAMRELEVPRLRCHHNAALYIEEWTLGRICSHDITSVRSLVALTWYPEARF